MRHLITAAAVIGILSMATTASAQTVTLDVSSVLYVSAHRVRDDVARDLWRGLP